MKLSDFLKPKTLSFIGDELIIENSFIDYSSIEFYELTMEQLLNIQKKVINKTKTEEEVAKFLYDIWEYITNIEKDLTYSKFKKLIESPNVDFMPIYRAVIKIINNLFKLTEEQEKLKNEANQIQENYSRFFPKEESLEEKILRLTHEMDNEKDFAKKASIFAELQALHEEFNNIKNG